MSGRVFLGEEECPETNASPRLRTYARRTISSGTAPCHLIHHELPPEAQTQGRRRLLGGSGLLHALRNPCGAGARALRRLRLDRPRRGAVLGEEAAKFTRCLAMAGRTPNFSGILRCRLPAYVEPLSRARSTTPKVARQLWRSTPPSMHLGKLKFNIWPHANIDIPYHSNVQLLDARTKRARVESA